ncbi:hypothetical protein BH10PSE4_BH10PSE4_41720 [soil metagenome]
MASKLGSYVVIRTYQADHGGVVFDPAQTRQQKTFRNRMTALMVIAAIAASAGVLQHFTNPAPGGSAEFNSGGSSAARQGG